MADLLPEQRPPEQPKTHVEVNADIKLTCFPDLGQATVIVPHRHKVRFTVLLESSSTSANDESEVCVWHSHNGDHDWAELHLQRLEDEEELLLVGESQKKEANNFWFAADLHGLPKHAQIVRFTIKYRSNPRSEWQWIKDSTGVEDGALLYQAPADFKKHSSYDLSHFFENVSSDIKISKTAPETPDTQLYTLTSTIGPAKGEDSGYQHHRLGQVKRCSKWFALVRLWSPWLAPRHGSGGSFQLDKDGVLLSFLRSDGIHVVCLAISGMQDVVTTFIHDESGNVTIKGRNDSESPRTSIVLVAVAENFEVANAAVMYQARHVIAENSVSDKDLSASTKEITALMDSNVKPEWLEEWYDGLTYCTWNGLGQALTAEKIHDALDNLADNNINVTNLIIDDNWQSLSSGSSQFQRGWSDFEANQSGFPDGLKKTTQQIRKRHPNVNHIAVWHAILGYWGGIDPDGKIAEKYKTVVVEKEPGVAGGPFTVVAAEESRRMYNDFYAFLADSGIDSVKTDAQFFLDMLLHAPDRRKMIAEYQDAWTIAHLRYFSSRAISCMSQFPQSLFHTQLPTNKPRLLVRNSDDFFPEVESSHAWHVFCNAHNSLLTQHLNALPDWDMFQTSHKWASFHAAARCVSGGPIYFTDKPGEHNIELIHQMTAQTPTNKTIILRPHIVGRTVGSVYNAYEALIILKIGTYVGMAKTGAGILGCFNVSPQSLREFVHLDDIPGTEEGTYVIGSFRSHEISKPVQRGDEKAMVGLELPTEGWDILTAYAVHHFTLHSKNVSVALMGLLGKMTGVAAITGLDMYVESNGRLRIWTSIKALGVLGLWVSDLEDRSIDQDFMIMIFGKPILKDCVRKSENGARKKILEIDVERAWKDSGEDPGWSNEVSLEIFIH